MNSINVIHPYKFNNQWVFDDPDKELVKEPFVSGADVLLDRLTAQVPNAEKGFILLFSAVPFPGTHAILELQGEDRGGNWYMNIDTEQTAWLCPALLKYFFMAPKHIYVQVKEKK